MNKKMYIGIDLGGTFIKGGVVDSLGNIVVIDKVPTEVELGNDKITNNIASLVCALIDKSGYDKNDFVGIGMGAPGLIDSSLGIIKCSENLYFNNYNMASELEKRCGLSVKIANDANVATLGEVKFGSAKDRKNAVMLTLGTGVGGGMVCNGMLVEGNESAGAELGHTVIKMGGEPCSCGRKGCCEAYASATALIRDTKRAMKKNPQSKMWSIGSVDNVDGKTAFDFYDTDPYAKEVIDDYIYALATTIVNFANVFRPEVVILGGGICAQGEKLTKPLQKIVDKELYGEGLGPGVEIIVAKLGNSAGVLGAAALLM